MASVVIKRIFQRLAMIALCTPALHSFSQENNSPVVKIIAPKDKNSFPPNTSVPYRIRVSDKEDGDSEYGEIAPQEVFLEVKYVTDISNLSMATVEDPIGLASMKKSNCFSCHAFNDKLIAPSFHEIAKRYPFTSANTELLARRIREGSGGIWGTASMPSHVEISIQQGKEIANWILKNGLDENRNYYIGPEGSFKMKTRESANQKGAYLLTATYADHGAKNSTLQSLISKDVIVVYLK